MKKRFTHSLGINHFVHGLSTMTIPLLLLISFQLSAQIVPNGNFNAGSSGWNIVNGTAPNKWFIGTVSPIPGPVPVGLSGNYAYISNSNGLNWDYAINTTSVVHFYRDITLPAGVPVFELTFDWINNGESTWDELMVSTAPTYYTPTASTVSLMQNGLPAPANTLARLSGKTTKQAASVRIYGSDYGNCNLPVTIRLIFTWKNDDLFGDNPPAALDNIVINEVPMTLSIGGGPKARCADASDYTFSATPLPNVQPGSTSTFNISPATPGLINNNNGTAGLDVSAVTSPGKYNIEYAYSADGCTYRISDTIRVFGVPKANLKETLAGCLTPEDSIDLGVMFDGSNSANGIWSQVNGPAVTLNGSKIEVPANGGCFTFRYVAPNPNGCPNAPYQDEDQLLITIQPNPNFTVTSPDPSPICSDGTPVMVDIDVTSTGPNPLITINGNPAVEGMNALPAPATAGSIIYKICLTETISIPAGCGSSLPGTDYDTCSSRVCKSITVYNDGNDCGANAAFASECPPDFELSDPCDVETDPSLDLSCSFFTLSGPDLIEAELDPVNGVISCSDEEVCFDWQGSLPGALGDIATGGPTLSELNVATEVICDIITFELCLDFGFLGSLCVDPIPLGKYEDYCDFTIGQIIFDLLGDLLGGDGGGGVIVADTDGDGNFDYAATDYVFPAASDDPNQEQACIPNNVKTPQGTITVRNVVSWPFAPAGACGVVNSEEINLLELLPIGAIPLVGIIIEDLLAAASCNVNLVFSDEQTVEIPVFNDQQPQFANCNDSGYVFTVDLNCDSELNWSIPVAYDGCYGGILPFQGRTAAVNTSFYNGSLPPLVVANQSGLYQTMGPVPGSDLPPGVYEVVYTAYSCAGIESECAFNVVVTAGDPALEAPRDFVVKTDVDQCQAVVTGLTPLQGIGCASIINYSVDYPAGSGFTDVVVNTSYSAANKGTHNDPSGLPFPKGVTTIIYTMLVDIDGDSIVNANEPNEIQKDTFTITVEDKQAPIATCVDVEVQLDNTGNVTVYALNQLNGSAYINGGSTDNCDATPTIEIAKPGGAYGPSVTYSCTQTGDNFVNLRVTDDDNNQRTCIARVRVNDFFDGIQYALDLPELCLEANNPSQFDFSNYLVITLPDGTTLNHSQVAANGYLGDAQGGFGITAFAPAPGSTNNPGTISQNGVYTPGTGSGFVTISYVMALPGVSIPQNGNLAKVGCFEIVHATFELRQPLNMGSPECMCFDNEERIVDLGVITGGLEPYRIQYSGTRLDVDGDGIADDADGSYIYDAANGHNINDFQQDLGELRVVYTQPTWSFTIVDARGCELFRSGSCDNDDFTEGPQILCTQPQVNLTTEQFLCESQYSWQHVLPTDNCAVVLYDYRIFNPDGTIEGPFNLDALLNIAPGAPINALFEAEYEFQLGTSTVYYYAEDAQGNFTTCTFLVNVVDNDPPYFINCPYPPVVQNAEDNHCDAYVDFALPLAADNCDMPVVTQIDNTGLTTGDRFPVGTTVMYWEAVDLAGNKDTCQVKVIVNDYWQVPTLTCPANVVQKNDNWLCGAVVNNIAPVYDGPCRNNYGVTYTIYGDAALTQVKDCGVANASGEFFDVGDTWVKYTVQNQPLLLITEVTQSGAVDRIEISNLGPAAIDITCLEIKRTSGTIAANQVIGPVTQLPSLAPSILPVGGTRVFSFAFNGATNLPACYTISYMGTIFDEVATNGFAGCNGFTGTLAGGDVIRKCEDDTNKAADWVLAENCYPLTIGAINPDLEVMPNNGTQTSLQSILPNEISCTFKVTIQDKENPFCGKLTTNTTYTGAGIANISAATCNRSTITIPPSNCIIGDIVFNRTGTATPANSTMTLISPKGIKVVVTEIPDDSLRTLFAQKAEGTWTLDIVPKPGQTPTITGWSLTINCIAPFDLPNQNLPNAVGQCGTNFTWTHPYFVDNCFEGTISVAYTSSDAACVPTGGKLLDIGGYSVTQFFCVGTTKVTYTLTDAAGNVSTCGFDVKVNDVEKPKVVCPADIFINLNGGECGAYVSYGPLSATDNCGVKDTVMTPPSGSWFSIGDKTVTIVISDNAGNTATCSFVVSVIEYVPSTTALICNDLTNVSLDATCVYVVNADAALEGSEYHCYDDYIITIKNNVGQIVGNTFTAANIGITYTVTVLDPETGNSCWTNMKIEDKLVPALTCPPAKTVACSESTQISNTGNVLIKDCSNTNTVIDDVFTDLGDCGTPRAQIVRTFIVTDVRGNQSTCSQTITISNFNLADVIFPADKTVDCETLYNNPAGTSPAQTGAPSINGASILGAVLCNAKVNYTDTYYDGCEGTYTILRQWNVLSDCLPLSPNNPVGFTQRIKVVDNGGPIFTCPANVTVSTDVLTCCATAALPDIIVSEGCSHIQDLQAKVTGTNPVNGNIITFTVGGYLGDFPGNNYWNPDTLAIFPYTQCLPQGIYNVQYTASDECANTSKCSFQLTIADLVPPISACDEFTQVALGIDGMAFINASTFDDGSYDNCAPVEFKARRMNANTCQSDTVFYDQVKFCCSDINDTILVVFRTYDVDVPSGEIAKNAYEGRYNDCMVQVLVEDKIKPACLPPANVTVTCENFDPSLWAYGKAEVTDNCCLDTAKVYQGQAGLTHSVNLSLFDTVCNKGTITRTFRAFDCGGNSSQCTQRVLVTYEQDYFVRFPNDVIVSTCDGTGNYGAPTFFGEDCELLGVSFEDEIFTVVPDACFKIERTWTVINWCTFNPNLPCINVPNPNPNATTNNPANLPGVVVSPLGTPTPWNPTVVKINPTDPTATNYSTFYDANANCYRYKQIIKIIDTQDPVATCPASPVEFCDLTPNDPQLWNQMYWWDNSIASHDLCEGEADLTITATDSCSAANVNFRYLLFLDLDGDNVMETVVSSTNLPGVNNVQFGNAANANYAGGTPRAFDGRPVPLNQQYRFGLDWTTSGKVATAKVRFDNLQSPIALPGTGNNVMQGVIPQLPYGTHKIKWFVEDGCGNETICEYTFVVKDCKKPTVVCLNGLSVNIMPTQMITLWASDFLQYTEDNCTPANQLKIAIRKSADATPGFPVDAQGNPITNINFTCDELGTQLVKLWSIDKAGNADFCETYVIVQDNMGNCPPSANAAKVAGVLATEAANGVEEGNVEIVGSGNGIPSFTFTTMTGASGNYNFNAIPLSSNSTVTPTKDDNPLNGVSTYDLVLISKHILGIESLSSPYKMIAADANKSGSITTFDIVEIRKLILGIYNELPNNTSWRFVDKSYSFPNANNPFQAPFAEVKSISNILSNKFNEDFVSVKVGDVNGNAIANAAMATEDRSAGTLLFDVDDRAVTVGETFTVSLIAAEQVSGYQFTMNHPGLEVVDITPGANMTAGNFGIFADAITTSFDGANLGEFAVTFRATKSGQLSEMLSVSSRITKAEAYPASAKATAGKLDVAFRFNNGATSTIAGVGFELYQNQPNPFVNKTFIGFHLPAEASAQAGATIQVTLSIFDETGRMVYNQKGTFAKGYNTIAIDKALLNTVGMLYYKLETATDSATKKMIQTK